MTDFHEQDLSGARFERVDLSRATFREVRLNDALIHDADLTGLDIRAAYLKGTRMRGVELVDLQIYGELENVTVNGVDIVPLVEAELNRRMPERAKMRPEDPDGYREAWRILEQMWEETVERARALPEELLHRNVDDEWSFIQTLRHLSFASAAWVNRTVLGEASPWHPLDLPWDEAPGWEGIPWDRDARPSLAEALAVREERQATVRGVIEDLSEDQLSSKVRPVGPGWPAETMELELSHCLRVVLNEEWEHRLYAERDLTVIEKEN